MIGDTYATLDELKDRLSVEVSDTLDDSELQAALASASREIEAYCRRQFNDAGTVSARVFSPLSGSLVRVDDLHTADGLVVATDEDGDGVYETTWSSTDYQLEPLDGVVDGVPGWPYSRIRAAGYRCFPTSRRPSVQVTARWGWSAVPAPVKEACLLIAAEAFKLKDAPFGVAGFGEFGPVRVRMNTRAQTLLAPYRRDPVLVA